MKNGKYARRRGVASKVLVMLLAVTMIVGISVGGTLAWLSDKTTEVKNTFTDSNIEIDLTETEEEYKMIPGWTIHKDPVVTVKAGSEDCWVFIEVMESSNLDEFITYTIDSNNWTKLENAGTSNEVYYTFCKDIEADRMIKVLLNNQVEVKDTVTKQMMDDLAGGTEPTLSFKAYAVQYWKDNDNAFTAEEAWAKRPTDAASGGAQG